ncbi:hypothetical protein EYF80_064112 [Liparis tanakae]|uniref:Uncharacterized protein n=1 Tax=Liparis tanakae TaxID=230148 RepID=A0A4Z2EA81_9TELE|nr:hypothetical protein EYF80_064112 [Liparis tanakae]
MQDQLIKRLLPEVPLCILQPATGLDAGQRRGQTAKATVLPISSSSEPQQQGCREHLEPDNFKHHIMKL